LSETVKFPAESRIQLRLHEAAFIRQHEGVLAADQRRNLQEGCSRLLVAAKAQGKNQTNSRGDPGRVTLCLFADGKQPRMRNRPLGTECPSGSAVLRDIEKWQKLVETPEQLPAVARYLASPLVAPARRSCSRSATFCLSCTRATDMNMEFVLLAMNQVAALAPPFSGPP
jgi:hypothetical protein